MSDPMWKPLIQAGECPVCGRHPAGGLGQVLRHIRTTHRGFGFVTSDDVRGHAAMPSYRETLSIRVKRDWDRLAPHERQHRQRGLAATWNDPDARRRSSEVARRTQEARPAEVKRAIASAMNANASVRAKQQWAKLSHAERLQRTAPARAVSQWKPGESVLPEDRRTEVARLGGLAAGKVRRLKRDRRLASEALDAIEALIRAEIRDPTQQERIDMRRLTRFLEETEPR